MRPGEREKVKEVNKRLTSLPDAELGWLAGIIDGEGYIGIRFDKPKVSKNLRAVLSVKMTHLATMELIANYFCCSLIQEHSRRGYKTLFAASVSGKKAEAIIKVLQPYLITKSEEAELFLRFTSTVLTHGSTISKRTLEYRQDLANELKRVRGCSCRSTF